MRNGGAAHKNIEAPRVFDQRHSRIVIPTEAEEFFRWPYDAGLLDEKMGNTVRQGSAVIRNDLSAEYNKDPSTSLGMTIRENVWSEVRSLIPNP